MNKKTIATFLVLSVLTIGLVTPAFAEGQQPSNPGFFGMMGQFFSNLFHPAGAQVINNSGPLSPTPEITAIPTGEHMDESRLKGLVTAGKITSQQEQEILAEINTIKSEISSWSSSTGINAAYIYGGLRGFGMDSGIGNVPSGVQPSGTQGRPMMHGDSDQNGVPAGKPLQGHMMGIPQTTQQ